MTRNWLATLERGRCFLTTCFTSWFLCFFSTGVYAGIKFFIIDFLFKSCPKLRDKYDTPYIVWNSLPTDPQLKERTNATVSRRVSGLLSHTFPTQIGLKSPRSCVHAGWIDPLNTSTPHIPSPRRGAKKKQRSNSILITPLLNKSSQTSHCVLSVWCEHAWLQSQVYSVVSLSQLSCNEKVGALVCPPPHPLPPNPLCACGCATAHLQVCVCLGDAWHLRIPPDCEWNGSKMSENTQEISIFTGL